MSTTHPDRQFLTLTPQAVDVATIEKELAKQWHFGGADDGKTRPVTRACMSNLLIYCSDGEQADAVSEEIPEIVGLHPSRVLLLIADGNTQVSDVQGFVSAHCRAAGEGWQVCSEHVTVRASRSTARRLPSVARSLLIGDLPTALWWASATPPITAGGAFQELSEMADQVIYDSVGWPDPVRGILAMAHWAGGADNSQTVSDLAWRRLKPWRRLIGQVLDPAVVPGALRGITDIRLEHGPHAFSQAWLLAGWLAARLSWRPAVGKVAPGTEVSWRFDAPQGPVRLVAHRLAQGQAEIGTLTITWNAPPAVGQATFAMLCEERLGVIGEQSTIPARVIAAPRPPRARLVTRQLPHLARDLAFRNALQVCGTMAAALA